MAEQTPAEKAADLYPQATKLNAVSANHDTIGEFLDWLAADGIHLVRYQKVEGYRNEQPVEIFEQSTALLNRFSGIDEMALEKERRAMLTNLRN